jgi:Na+/H+ antiporter NhaA
VREVGLTNYQSLNNYRLDLFHKALDVVSFSLEEFEHGLKRALMALVVFFLVLILLEFIVELIDGIVCEVHEKVVEVGAVGGLILLCGEPSYSLLVQIYPKRIHSVK